MSNDPRALSDLSQADFEAIEQAVMETARGRWFLREYAARNRNADTNVLLDAIGRLQNAVTGGQAYEQIERVRYDLVEMAKSIARLKIELETGDPVAGEGSRFGDATVTLDGIVQTTEHATSSILEAAESIQEIAWSLREQLFDEMVCDKIDKLATDIYTSCGFQDLTAQRTQKVVRTLRFLEGRINALIDAWSGPLDAESLQGAQRNRHGVAEQTRCDAAGPAFERVGTFTDMSQSDVDIVIVDDQFDHSFDALRHDRAGAAAFGGADQLSAAYPCPPQSGDDLVAGDEQDIIIDDLDVLDVDFVMTDDDSSPHIVTTEPPAPASARHGAIAEEARPATADAQTGLSLAQMDALPAAAKALIYG